jgi:hypothetical protein
MNFCGGSWYCVFVVKITGIEGGVAVEEDAAMSLWLKKLKRKGRDRDWIRGPGSRSSVSKLTAVWYIE